MLLLHGVAAGNPRDERLVALAQVRELAVVRDETGQVTALPHIERALATCLEAIRRVRAAPAPGPGSTPTTSGCTSGRRSRPTSTS